MSTTAIPSTIVRVLNRTPRHKWNSFVVVVDNESASAKLMGRGELAAWLTANDLRALAAECLVRRVPLGALILLHIGIEETRFRIVGGETRRPGVLRGRTAPARAPIRHPSTRDHEARRNEQPR